MFGTASKKSPRYCYGWGVEPLDGTAESYWAYHEPYYRECRRVLRAGGALAWSTGAKFHFQGDHWSPRRDWFGDFRLWSLHLYHNARSVNTFGHSWVVQTAGQQPIPFPPDADGAIVTGPRSALSKAHPCSKSLAEMLFLVEHLSRPGEVILDIFCGIGTTLIAAKLLGRHFLGAEKRGEHAAIAQWRCEQEKTSVVKVQVAAHDKRQPKEATAEAVHKRDGTAPPQWLFDALDQQVRALTGRGFELDAAASRHNTKCPNYYDEEIDALSRDWSEWDVVYCNPPFSAKLVARFAEKALRAASAGTTVVMLVPFWPGYPWFQELMGHGQMQTISGPLAFRHDSGKTVMLNNGRRSGSIVVITLGPHIRPGTNGAPIHKPPRPATGPKSKREGRKRGLGPR
jgi:phage N-6-adenine-methyltransferase